MLDDIYKSIAVEMDLPVEVVKRAYTEFWSFIKTSIEDLPLRQVQNEEEFSSLRTSFNLPSLGKIYTTFDKIEGVRRKMDYVKELMQCSNSKE